MNKKALSALLLALLLPLICYFIVKKYSEEAVTMPRHYFDDSVSTRVSRGKTIPDTIWHKLPEFELTNQLGDKVKLSDLHGKIIIADFFFTHCPTICPGMTRNMKRLQESLTNAQRVGDKTNRQVHFLSFSIDPENDSVERLKAWADRFQVNPDQWWLLTGNKKTIYDIARNDIRLPMYDGHGVADSFVHSDRFVLIDSSHHIRGYYRGLDSVSLSQLTNDLVLLTMEKDKTKPGFLAGKLQMLAVVFLLAIAAVGLFFIFFRKPK